MLIAAAAIHLDLYLTGYRSIPVIGGLFLLQVIVGFLASVVVLVTGSRLAAAAGAVFALATLGGYLLSVSAGLFGFKEVRTTAGIADGVMEVAAFAALAALAARPRPSGRPSRPGALAELVETSPCGQRPPQTFTHVTPGGKMSTPTDDNAFLHALELNVRTELALAETGQPEEEAVGVPIEEWLSDPADTPRYEAGLRSLLGAVEALEDASGPRDHPPPAEVPESRPQKQKEVPDGHHDGAAGARPRRP